MKKTIVLILSLLMIVTLAACGEDEEETSQPPVFQSLEVNGQVPGENDDEGAFRFEKNEEFTLELQLSNPDNVEFNTVQINGTTFRAHRFSSESSTNTLILNLNAGRIPDETTFEIEEIEYIDNEGVKSIDITENNAYTIFIMRGEPSATFASLNASETSFEFEVTLSDEDETLEEASVEVVRESDETVVDSMEVPDNYLSDTFENLRSDETYYLRIVADYKTDDPSIESGLVTEAIIATSNSVSTPEKDAPTVAIDNAVASETSYEFDIVFNDESEVLIGDTLYLEVEQINEDDDNDIVIEKNVNIDDLQDIVFDSLLNNNDYRLYVYGDYDLEDGEGVRENELLTEAQQFTTPKKEIEDITTKSLETTESSLTIGVDATDFYDSIVVETMRIIAIDPTSGEEMKSSELLTQEPTFKLNKLYANQTVDIEIEVTYDLQDGQNLRTEVLHESSFTTSKNTIPSASVDSLTPSQGGLSFSIQLNDSDETVMPGTLRARIYEDNGEEFTQVATHELDETLSTFFYEMDVDYDNAYSIELITDYSLRDNTGSVEDYELDSSYVSADAKAKDPVAFFEAISPTKEGAVIDYRILDNDATIIEDGIELVVDGTPYSLTSLDNTYTLDTLLSDETYEALLRVTYDLNDGEGEQTLELTETFTTDSKETPTLSIDALTSTQEGVEAPSLTITDPNSTGSIESIAVLKDGSEVSTWNEGEAITDLMSDSAYTLEVVYGYDLNDGEGNQTLTITETFTTNAKAAPTGTIKNSVIDQESIGFDYEVTDTDGVITSIEYTVDGASEPLTELTDTIGETGLLSDTAYTPTFTITYDLNDGEGEQTLELTESFTTEAKTSASATITSITESFGTIGFDVEVTDEDGTLVDGTLTAELVDESDQVLQTWNLSVGNQSLSYSGNHYGETLTINVKADIDLNEEANASEPTTLASDTVEALNRVTSTLNAVTEASLTIDINSTQLQEEVTLSELRAYAYDSNGVAIKSTKLLGKNATFEINDLHADQTVTIEIEATLSDGTKVIVHDANYQTNANSVPSASITNIDLEQTGASFSVALDNPDNTIVAGTLSAHLYKDDGTDTVFVKTLEDLDPTQGSYFIDAPIDHTFAYSIELEVTYDLRDDTGEETITLDTSYTSYDATPKVPEISIDGIAPSQESGDVTYTIHDNDATITLDPTLSISGGASSTLTAYEGVETFASLLSNTSYDVTLSVTYDLGDGTGAQTLELTESFTTDSKETPTLSIDALTPTKEGLAAPTFTITDPDSTGSIESITVLKDGTEVSTWNEGEAITGLMSDTAYTLEVVYGYDLNDGEGNQTLTNTQAFTTNAKTGASSTIDSTTINPGVIDIDLSIVDGDATVVPGSLQATIKDDAGNILNTFNPSVGTQTLSHYAFIYGDTLEFELTANIDLNDGTIQEDVSLSSTTLVVPEYVTFDIAEEDITENSFKGTLDLNELTGTVDFDSVETLITYPDYDGEILGDAFTSNKKLIYDVDGLLADRQVKLTVKASYDVGNGIENGVVFETTLKTTANEAPTGTLSNVGFDKAGGKIPFDLEMNDPDNVINDGFYATVKLYRENAQGELELYKTMEIPEDPAEPANPDDPQFAFEGLDLDYREFYVLEVEADYYLRDARGNHVSVNLDTDTVRIDVTPDEPTATISDITLNKGDVTFDVDVTDKHETIETDTLYARLLQGGSEVKRVALSTLNETVTFTELMNNTAYTLDVIGDVDLKEASIRSEEVLTTATFTSLDVSPNATIDSVTTSKGEVAIDYTVTDSYDTVVMNSFDAVLYESGTEVDRIALTSLTGTVTFTELINNTNYTVELVSNLDYGEPTIRENVLLATDTFTSLDVSPSSALSVSTAKGEASIDYTVTDTYDTVLINTFDAVLYESGTEVNRIALTSLTGTVTFTELSSDTEYTVELESDLDYAESSNRLNQVIGSKVFQSLDVSPNISYTIDNTTHSRIDFTLNEADPYDVFASINRKIEVYNETGVLIATFSEVNDQTEIALTNLLADHTYTLRYFAEVNYLDGDGIKELELYSDTVQTNAYTVPTASIDTISPSETDVSFNLALNDPDSIGATLDSIELYRGETLDDSILDPAEGQHSFTGLFSDTAYKLLLTYSYDLQDGAGVQTVTVEETFSTLAYTTPTVSITQNTLDHSSINFTVSQTDPDTRLNTLTAIELLKDGVVTDTIDPAAFGTHDFNNLLSDTTYTIRATYTYDMNDNQGEQTAVSEHTFTTDAYTEPSVSITTANITKEGADVTVSLSDPDSMATLDEYVIASTVDIEETLTTGIEGLHTYTTLYSDETYTVTVTYSYDLNDGADNQIKEEVITFTTDAYTAPTGELTNMTFSGNDLTVDVATLTNPDNVATTLDLILYVDGVQQGILTDITDGTTQTFTDVYAADSEFTVVLTADYDLNESSGAHTDVILDQSKLTALSQ